MTDPVERLSALLPERRAPFIGACVAAVMVLLVPFTIIYLGPTEATPQERPRTVPPPSYAELDSTLRIRIVRNGDLVVFKGTLGKTGALTRIMPMPVQWSVGCDGGFLSITVGAVDADNNVINLPMLLTDADCTATATNAARILKQILD